MILKSTRYLVDLPREVIKIDVTPEEIVLELAEWLGLCRREMIVGNPELRIDFTEEELHKYELMQELYKLVREMPKDVAEIDDVEAEDGITW